MNTRVLLLGCLLALASQAQSATRTEIWEWTDANGVRHFSDAPVPGARKMVIVGDTARSPAPPVPAATTSARGTAAAVETKYNSLELLLPENEASFFGTDAVVQVRIQSNPEVAPSDRLLTFLDGRMLEPANLRERELTNLERGAHSVMAVIADSRGVEKIRSASRTFYIKQNSIINNPRNQGPSVRPPAPKPATPR